MKVFSLSSRFYIFFVLVAFISASIISSFLSRYLAGLQFSEYFQKLFTVGIIEQPTTVAIIFIFFWITNHYLWKIKFIRRLCDLPDINGRYEGELVSSFSSVEKHSIAVEIRQSLTKISVTLYTKNSSSFSLIANIGKNHQDNWTIFYVYQNQTNTVNANEDMKDHNGTCFLEIFEDGSFLRGNYYNNPRDRGRHGKINVKRVSGLLKKKFN